MTEQTFEEQLNALYELVKYCNIAPKQFEKVFRNAKSGDKLIAKLKEEQKEEV